MDDHYATLGIQSDGAGPLERVIACASVQLHTVKEFYQASLRENAGNPFALAKISQAFRILSSPEDRRQHDLKLMSMAASVPWFA